MQKPLSSFSPGPPGLRLSGSLERKGPLLEIAFSWSDPGKHLLEAPQGSAAPRRADELWRSTCFEAFWGLPGRQAYWELNLSGQGRLWNLYSFDSYRSPGPAPRWSDEFSLERWEIGEGSMSCVLAAGRDPGPLEASLCAVLLSPGGTLYFSTMHAGAKPDFHLRSSFCLRA